MGKKMTWEQAAKMGLDKSNDSIFAPPNKYGYKININHPEINPMYEAYKKRIGERILSDAQRLHFESLIFRMMDKSNK